MAPGGAGLTGGAAAGAPDFVTWALPRSGDDGGTARIVALAEHVRARGGRVLDVAELSPGGAAGYARGLLRLLAALRRGSGPIVLGYPGFPALGVYGSRHSVSAAAYGVAATALLAIAVLARRSRRTLVVDVHDLPSLEQHLPERARLAPARLTSLYERLLLRAAQAVWVVTAEERDALVRGQPPRHTTFVVVPNGAARIVRRAPRAGGPVRVAYTGSLYRDRDVLSWTIRELLASDGAVELELAGPDGDWVAADFPDERVHYRGWLPARECEELLVQCDIGLLPYFAEEPYYAIVHPTKLSTYLACGLAVACGDAAHPARFVSEQGVGVAARRSRFPAAVLRLAGDQGLRESCAARAEAVAPSLLWDGLFANAFAATPPAGAVRGAAPRPRG